MRSIGLLVMVAVTLLGCAGYNHPNDWIRRDNSSTRDFYSDNAACVEYANQWGLAYQKVHYQNCMVGRGWSKVN
jgi:hypothetical protein